MLKEFLNSLEQGCKQFTEGDGENKCTLIIVESCNTYDVYLKINGMGDNSIKGLNSENDIIKYLEGFSELSNCKFYFIYLENIQTCLLDVKYSIDELNNSKFSDCYLFDGASNEINEGAAISILLSSFLESKQIDFDEDDSFYDAEGIKDFYKKQLGAKYDELDLDSKIDKWSSDLNYDFTINGKNLENLIGTIDKIDFSNDDLEFDEIGHYQCPIYLDVTIQGITFTIASSVFAGSPT